jgi:hypothetical protein
MHTDFGTDCSTYNEIVQSLYPQHAISSGESWSRSQGVLKCSISPAPCPTHTESHHIAGGFKKQQCYYCDYYAAVV